MLSLALILASQLGNAAPPPTSAATKLTNATKTHKVAVPPPTSAATKLTNATKTHKVAVPPPTSAATKLTNATKTHKVAVPPPTSNTNSLSLTSMIFIGAIAVGGVIILFIKRSRDGNYELRPSKRK